MFAGDLQSEDENPWGIWGILSWAAACQVVDGVLVLRGWSRIDGMALAGKLFW